MYKKLIICFLFFSTTLTAQELFPINQEPLDADVYWGFDTYKNLYYTKNNTLFKKTDDTIISYQNLGLGKIEKVDFYNPLMVMVFYKNFNSIVLLDNQLNEVSQLRFSELKNPLVVTQAGISSQNEIWFYDELTQKIGLINSKTSEIKFLSNAIVKPIISSFATYNNWFYISENRELFSVNRFGKIEKLATLPPFDKLWFTDQNRIVYNYQSKIYGFSIKNSTFRELNLDIKNIEDLYYNSTIISIFTGTEIKKYQLNLE